MSIQGRIDALNNKHAELDGLIKDPSSLLPHNEVTLKGWKYRKAQIKNEIAALGGQTPGMVKEAELSAQKQEEETAEAAVEPDKEEVSKTDFLPKRLRHHDFDVQSNDISSVMGRIPDKVAAA